MQRVLFSMALMVLLAGLATAAWAGDVDPDGEKLMSLKNDPKYQEALEKIEGGEGGANWGVICWLEYATGFGMYIWEQRMIGDECHCGWKDVKKYCTDYSNHCPHYKWHADCLKKKGCPPCNK